MNRDALDQLDRDALVAKAEEAGVTRARVLTRPELVDELLLRSAADHATRQRARGLFGRARDLIARVVERGLHLPDAAERIRALGFTPPVRHTAPAALPTVTLAQIYAAQGHRERAVDTLQKVLAREPEHAVAASLLTKLRDANYRVPPPAMPPEQEALAATPEGEPGDAPPADSDSPPAPSLPLPSDVDECRAVLVAPTSLRVSFRMRGATLEHAREDHPGAKIAACILVVRPTWDGPRPTVRCHELDAREGDFLAGDLPPGCVVRAAVGCLDRDVFVPFSHSPASETPGRSPAAGSTRASPS